jgi:hypothetical protein
MPVKVIAAVLYKERDPVDKALEILSRSWGRVDYESPALPFDVTDYYHREMGSPLSRLIVSFENLLSPSALAEIKRDAMQVEKALLNPGGGRSVNLDSGYMDYDKVVLASVKPGPYKVYVRDDIWADMTLHYEKGAFRPFPWTFADFRDGRYDKSFLRIREIFKKQRPSS